MPGEPQTTVKQVKISAAARLISVRVATVSGSDFPRALVSELARVLPAAGAILAERSDASSRWRSVACRFDDEIVPEFEFELNEEAVPERRRGQRIIAGRLNVR